MRILFVAASALALLAGVAPTGAITLTEPASVRSAATQIDATQRVARVCRDVCNDFGQCRRQCWNEPSARVYDDDDPPPRVYYDRRRYDPPGVGIYGPGIGIELGRPRW